MKLRRMGWDGHVVLLGDRRVRYIVLVAKPDGKRPHGRPRHRLENNINP